MANSKRNALLLKSAANPNMQALVTLRTNSKSLDTFPVAKLTTFFYMGDQRVIKDWLGLQDLYRLNFFLKRIITLMEDYNIGDLDLEKLLNTEIDLTKDEKFIVE